MMTRIALPLCVLACAVLLAPRAHACPHVDHEIADTAKPKVGVFDETGKFREEIPKAQVVHQKIIACNESLGLVQIAQADGKTIWLDLAELKIPTVVAAASTTVCVNKNSAAPADKQVVVSSGAGPKSACADAK